MKVNQEHIEKLYAFTRKHYVVYYDLQTELVDHLAMGIEAQWADDPDLSFEEALQKEFKKFGVFGFMGVVEKRQEALGKKYTKLIWKHIKTFFTIPKILLVVVSTAILFFTLRATDFTSANAALFASVIFLTYFIFVIVSDFRTRRKVKNKKERLWMFEEIIGQHGKGFGLGFLPIYFFQYFFSTGQHQLFSEMSWWTLLLISFLFVMLCIFIYVISVEIPQRAKEYLIETYPEYRLVEGQ